MRRDEFIKRYHDYNSQPKTVATTEALLVNAEGILDDQAVVVHFGNLGYGLMLRSAAEYLFKPEEKAE